MMKITIVLTALVAMSLIKVSQANADDDGPPSPPTGKGGKSERSIKQRKSERSIKQRKTGKNSDEYELDCGSQVPVRTRRHSKKSKKSKNSKTFKKSKKGKKSQKGSMAIEVEPCATETRTLLTGRLVTTTTTITVLGDTTLTTSDLDNIAESFRLNLESVLGTENDDTTIKSVTIIGASAEPYVTTYDDREFRTANPVGRKARQAQTGLTVVTETFLPDGTNVITEDLLVAVLTAAQTITGYESSTTTTTEDEYSLTTDEGTSAPSPAGTSSPVGSASIRQGEQSNKYVRPDYQSSPKRRNGASVAIAVGIMSIGVAMGVVALKLNRTWKRSEYEKIDSRSALLMMVGDLKPVIH